MFNWFKKTRQEPKMLGELGEEFARMVYLKRGYRVIAANFFNRKGVRKGEVDFIATNGSRIVFVEVKTRGRDMGKFGSPRESVSRSKQAKLLKAVKVFLLQNPRYASLAPRLDVCEVVVNDPSLLVLVQAEPPKYVYRDGVDPLAGIESGPDGKLMIRLDKSPFSVRILVNAVEDSAD